METKTSFTQAHLENKLIGNELEFFREEMNIYQVHLRDLVNRNTSLQQSERADYFENQFARLAELVNLLEQDLHHAERQMAQYVQQNETRDLDEVNIGDHQQFKSKVDDFRSRYLQVKQEFREFEASI